MKNQPKELVHCKLDVLLMPQGEILCLGKTVGWFKEFKKHLEPISDATGKPFKG